MTQLIEAGADVQATTGRGATALSYALSRAENIHLADLPKSVKILIAGGCPISNDAKERVTALGEKFEFYRDVFAKDMLADTEAGLNELYEIFGVTPAAAREMHDGTSRIAVTGASTTELFDNLVDFFVPGSGIAKTVQGEALRIAGKLYDEMNRNGGGNWDREFRKITTALGTYLNSGTTVGNADELDGLLSNVSRNLNASRALCLWTARWVNANRDPVPLPTPDYKR